MRGIPAAPIGSSPRTWGTVCPVSAASAVRRFIPTHVGNSVVQQTVHRALPVHPHARGEQSCQALPISLLTGSSPRTWGTGIHQRRRTGRWRFIPTHVGNSLQACVIRAMLTVHPHARGEQSACSCVAWLIFGSSPRTWGTAGHADDLVSGNRFIPTHVGNRPMFGSSSPFLCGSSPRTWGTASVSGWPCRRRRFIPTHVGNRSERQQRLLHGIGAAVHPHACGEQAPPAPNRMRPIRFIPTHVGNSWSRHCGSAPRPVHPHARGEQIHLDEENAILHGSSPRTWGTVSARHRDGHRMRFIPTHVGNRVAQANPCASSSVHPHARGEQLYAHCVIHISRGSSPRTWGTARSPCQDGCTTRFIPTHVGNSSRS